MADTEYKVRPGDCMSSIAFEHGFFPETLWDHNKELKQKRKKMNHLESDDIVNIPEKEEKEESAATEQKHRFRKKGVPAKLKLKIYKLSVPESDGEQSTTQEDASQTDTQFEEPHETAEIEEEPWTDCPFTLVIDGEPFEGTTDGEGFLEIFIPPNASQGTLIMNPDESDRKTYSLRLGTLGSADEIVGMKRRLSNLGFDCGDQLNEVTESFEAVLRIFQEIHELEISGELDDPTKNKVLELTD